MVKKFSRDIKIAPGASILYEQSRCREGAEHSKRDANVSYAAPQSVRENETISSLVRAWMGHFCDGDGKHRRDREQPIDARAGIWF